MNQRWPQLERVIFEETPERLKVTLPVRRQWPFLLLYSLLLIIWVVSLGWAIGAIVRAQGDLLGTLGLAIWIVIVLFLLFLWLRLGMHIARWWQYYLAGRELLFLDKETLIVRRPLSIFGVTDAYDWQHVAPFYYSEKHDSPAFPYGSRSVLFGQALTPAESEALLAYLNGRYFPDYEEG